MPAPARPTTLCLLLLFAAAAGGADADREAAITKQKAAAEANLKTAGAASPVLVETDDLLLTGTVPEAKLKAMAPTLQKTYATAVKGLAFEKDSPWPGKLTVYVFADRKQFVGFVKDTEQRRVDATESSVVKVSGSSPAVMQGVGIGEKPNDAQTAADASATVANALLQARAGAAVGTVKVQVPYWVQAGFGRAVALRNDPTKLAAHRAKVKTMLKAKGTWPKAADLWGDEPPKDADVLAVSLVEYMAFGPDAAKFPKFAQAFRPADENDKPSAATALTAADWTADGLDAAWKKWVNTGK